jgi:hypothetical protein
MQINKLLSELPDQDFINLMDSKRSDNSWSLGEIEEFERRGETVFKKHPALLLEIQTVINVFTSKVEGFLEDFRKHSVRLVELSNLKIRAFEGSSFRLSKFSELARDVPHLLGERLSSRSVLGAERELVQKNEEMAREYLSLISVNTSWDWKHWIMGVATLVAAITSLWPLFD